MSFEARVQVVVALRVVDEAVELFDGVVGLGGGIDKYRADSEAAGQGSWLLPFVCFSPDGE